jgi:hypothetical protein
LAGGALALGSAVAGLAAAFGTLAALFLLLLGGPTWLLVGITPWLTSIALGGLAIRCWRESRAHFGPMLSGACVIAGVALTAGSMVLAIRADASWLAPRLEAFDGDDVDAWEKALADIRAHPLCGHRRCLMPVCIKLMMRFGKTTGELGPFASPFGLAWDAPDVPSHLATPFEKVYGYPLRQVCVLGD